MFLVASWVGWLNAETVKKVSQVHTFWQ